MISIGITLTDLYVGSRPLNWKVTLAGKERILNDPNESSKIFVGENFGFKTHAAQVIFSNEHYLEKSEVMPMFGWSESEFVEIPHNYNPNKTLFEHWSIDHPGAEFIDGSLSPFLKKIGKANSSITLYSLEAFLPYESWLNKIVKYMNDTSRKINLSDIKGFKDFDLFVRQQYPDYETTYLPRLRDNE